ncbi:MAG: ankyrin repeat domain-containing protein, partial [Candidatus Muiribacteriota bacterium]
MKKYCLLNILLIFFISVFSFQTDEFGNNTLHTYIYSKNIKDFEKALSKNYNNDFLNHKNNNGTTPLILAVDYNLIDFIDLLLKSGADIEAKNDIGNTALMTSVQKNNLKITFFLIKSGADVNTLDIHGYRAISFALLNNNIDVFTLLVENGAHTDFTDPGNSTLAELIIINNKKEFFKILIDNNKKIKIKPEIFTASSLNSIDLYIYNHLFDKFSKNAEIENHAVILNGGKFNTELLFSKTNIAVLILILALCLTLIYFYKKLNFLSIIFLTSLPLIILLLVYSQNFVKCDEWNVIDFLQRFKFTRFSSYSSLFYPNSVHIIFTLKLYSLIISTLFSYNSVFFMFTSLILHILTFYIIIKANNFSINKKTVIFSAILFFSLRQFENFFWAFQLGFVFCYCFAVISFYYSQKFLETKKSTYYYSSVLTAFISSISSFMGIITFIPLTYITVKHFKLKKLFSISFILILISFLYYIFAGEKLLNQSSFSFNLISWFRY